MGCSNVVLLHVLPDADLEIGLPLSLVPGLSCLVDRVSCSCCLLGGNGHRIRQYAMGIVRRLGSGIGYASYWVVLLYMMDFKQRSEEEGVRS